MAVRSVKFDKEIGMVPMNWLPERKKFLIVTGKFSGMVPPIWLLLRSLFQYSTNDGQKDEYFTRISDPTNLHINARFIGLRPSGRTRDFIWIQALGLVLPNNSHTFTVEATRSHKWEEEVDHLRFTYDDHPISLPEGHLSQWQSAGNEVAIERTAFKNNVAVDIEGVARISISVVPITEDDDRVHKYGVPKNDCFAHLEVQFEFLRTGPEVEGVLGRTYSPDYASTAKMGVAMPVIGGEDKYKTSSLLSTNCKVCSFFPMLAN